METILLSELAVRGNCKVFKVTGDRSIKKRLLEMGFVKGTEIYVEKVAPLGDPMELVLKGYHLSLRRDEAKDVHVSI
ncbi:MAG: ferrous iron transport protein A [Candidatus Omnitrophica bacterium]|nr:ferrous iron transport protein A [Candidatus Omnitrophota bacterium]